MNKTISLTKDIEMPMIGFGTYFINIKDTYTSVLWALKSGYRLIDSAKWYQNEIEVGKAIRDSKIKREELFIISKVEAKTYSETIDAVKETLQLMELDYLDLVLIHWPTGKLLDTYKALEDLYDQGLIKAIGLSNFHEDLCDFIIHNSRIKPVLNQVETHIYFQEKKMHKYLKKNHMIHQSWSPFAEGYMDMLKDKTLEKIANKYHKSVAQIILRFLIQKNIVVIPKSTNPIHITENINIFDFELEKDDMKIIEKLDRKEQYSKWPYNMIVETYY